MGVRHIVGLQPRADGRQGWGRAVCVLLCAVGLAGCAALPLSQPWVDSRHDGGSDQRVGVSTLDKPVICYAEKSQMAKVWELAKAECARTNRVAVLDHIDGWQCRALTPRSAVFNCQ